MESRLRSPLFSLAVAWFGRPILRPSAETGEWASGRAGEQGARNARPLVSPRLTSDWRALVRAPIFLGETLASDRQESAMT